MLKYTPWFDEGSKKGGRVASPTPFELSYLPLDYGVKEGAVPDGLTVMVP